MDMNLLSAVCRATGHKKQSNHNIQNTSIDKTKKTIPTWLDLIPTSLDLIPAWLDLIPFTP